MKRILVIKLGALGDVVIASAAIQQLLAYHQNQSVDVLTAPAFAPLLANIPGLRVLLCERRGWRSLLAAAAQLRRCSYQRVYDLQGSNRSRLLSKLSGAGERIGLWPGWPYTVTPEVPRKQPLHPFERINLCLDAAGIAVASPAVGLPAGAQQRQMVADWLGDHSLSERTPVLLHAGCNARWHSKRWPEQSFLQLAQALDQAGLAVIWIGGPDDQAINNRLASGVGVDATGVFPLPTLPALGAAVRFAVVNDSGPMHVLAASGIPVYSFFGPTDWRRSHALGQAERVFSAGVDCSPCFQPQCPRQHDIHCCMTRITPQQVLQRLQADGLLSPD